MDEVSAKKIFSASFFSNADGVLQYEDLRLIRNYSAYYQEIFSLFAKFSANEDGDSQSKSWHELFKAGHHGTWQTISSLNNFYFSLLEEKNFIKRNQLLCEMLSAQGWGQIRFTSSNNQEEKDIYYQVKNALAKRNDTTAIGEAFYSGMVLAIYSLSRLENRQEITQEFLERELEKSFSLVQRENLSGVADDFYSFKVTQ